MVSQNKDIPNFQCTRLDGKMILTLLLKLTRLELRTLIIKSTRGGVLFSILVMAMNLILN